jgi:hypothetical protein
VRLRTRGHRKVEQVVIALIAISLAILLFFAFFAFTVYNGLVR